MSSLNLVATRQMEKDSLDVVPSVLAHVTDLRAILDYYQHIFPLTHGLAYLVEDVGQRHEADGNTAEEGVPRANA